MEVVQESRFINLRVRGRQVSRIWRQALSRAVILHIFATQKQFCLFMFKDSSLLYYVDVHLYHGPVILKKQTDIKSLISKDL